MAVSSISISSTLPLSTTRPSLSSSFSSSNSLFFSTIHSSPFPGSLQSSARTNNNSIRRRKGGLSCTCLFGLGVPELAVIAGVAALVFGPKQLPEIGRTIGKTVKSFQQAAKEFESELKKDPESAAEFESELKNDPESAAESPAEKVKAITDEEGQDAKVSSINES